ncbi:SpaA isopeptide-forming pilin-related protein [Floccifex sp.]|uniref:vWA domain-containing protein n=1 Tax=Floccifex sp. TaxID=2815810 RepID=UPI003F09584B
MKHMKQLKYVLAGIVALTTVFALIRPAITLETICGKEEHIHSDNCYKVTQETIVDTSIDCSYDSLHVHVHSPSCYNQDNELICGYADYIIHEHNEDCYNENNELICPLPEIKEHSHDSSCYDSENHLICGQQEIIEHKHNSSCYDQEGNLICEYPELEKHVHDENCITKTERILEDKELICTKEEHVHTEECYPDETDIEQVISMIDSLESSDEIKNQLDAQKEDKDAYNVYLQNIQNQVLNVQNAYNQLTEDQKSKVTNFNKFNDLLWILDEEMILDQESVFVSELNATNVKVNDEEAIYAKGKDEIDYEIQVNVDSYVTGFYKEGKIKIEVTLPVDENKAVFDLDQMTWLEEPQVIKEENQQILTAYKLIEAENESAIPSSFTDSIVLDVKEIEEEQNVSLVVHASNEEKDEGLTVQTKTIQLVKSYTKEEKEQLYQDFLKELETLSKDQLEEFAKRVQVSYDKGYLTKSSYESLKNKINELLNKDTDVVAEPAIGTNWMALRDSGYFEEYSQYSTYSQRRSVRSAVVSTYDLNDEVSQTTSNPSDVQVVEKGGTNASDDGSVSVSKTINGTDLENVFDITLQVQTSTKIDEIIQEPDMAIVIVMDISNTMNSNFGGVTRYQAAMTSAENFLDQFAANNSLGISKIGYVAFNTDAHQIFGLQSCKTQDEANALKNTMRTQTGSIINAAGYSDSHSRFTNIEAGLAMASDMLNGVSNKNKYIIFLSDGFPTTYISSGYSGYDPYDSNGTRFKDRVLNKPCSYGTSYSDEAAIRARQKATFIKENLKIKIFSIGVDVAGQTIQKYITQSENADGFSVVDRTGTTYEIGEASSTEAYKNWLRNSIGSGYYYDSTDSDRLNNAYNLIFAEIKHQTEQSTIADWVASDPIPSQTHQYVEFIGFYNKTPELVEGSLNGSYVENGENTASFSNNEITWNLKQSGYTTSTSNNTTWYTYELVYRVRLENERNEFIEKTDTEEDSNEEDSNGIYPTNDTTTLQYKNVIDDNGNVTMSSDQTIEFPIPSVKGYLCDLTFTKVDATTAQTPLNGAIFTLVHVTKNCGKCRGDGTSIFISDQIVTSNKDGIVTFTNIPSGHTYTLLETEAPNGYSPTSNTYSVVVSYDTLTVYVNDSTGESVEWNGKVVNHEQHILPSTGGPGDWLYIGSGIGLIMIAGYFLIKRRIHGKEDIPS